MTIHIEIESMDTVKSGAMHIHLINNGWKHTGDNGKEDTYSNPDILSGKNMTLKNAYDLQKIKEIVNE